MTTSATGVGLASGLQNAVISVSHEERQKKALCLLARRVTKALRPVASARACRPIVALVSAAFAVDERGRFCTTRPPCTRAAAPCPLRYATPHHAP